MRRLHFSGPFSAVDDGAGRCLFTDTIAAQSGVYLWSVEVNGVDRPCNVGQTRYSFGQRIGGQLVKFLSGQYPIYDPVLLMRGEQRLVDGAINGAWPQTLPAIIRNHERLMPSIRGLVGLIRFHLAILDGDKHLHDRVEAAIGRFYTKHQDPVLRDFFFSGLRLPARIPSYNPMRLMLSSDVPLAGLPSEISE
jgi:hypothetical protein